MMMMMRSKSKAGNGAHNRFMRILRLPIRVLIRARDLYVRSMTEYADRVGYGNFGYAQYPALPRSFSSASSRRSGENNADDDLRELIRAASATRFGDRIDVDAILRKRFPSSSTVGLSKVMALPKSRSVGIMDRIDEDDFEGDENDSMKKKKKKKNVDCDANADGFSSSFYPRSRSCVVG